MNRWFIAICVSYVLSLGVSLGRHGQDKNEKYNFWATLASLSIQLFLTYKAIQVGF